MEQVLKAVLIYFLFISVLSAAVCIFDKLSAVRQGRRVSEKNLLLLCVLGGSIAMYVTMRIIRHKTRHNKFMIGIPVIIVVQVIFLIAITYFLKN